MATAATESWPLVKLTDAAQVLADMGGDAPLPAQPGTSPQAYFGRLASAGQLPDAVMFLAHALPRYECIVWATRSLIESDAVPRRDPLMTAVLRWVDSPDDQVRRSVQALAELEKGGSPVILLANAVFFSGGSISDPEFPAVLPPAHVCAKMAGGAMIKAAYTTKDPAASLRLMLSIGQELASGRANR